MAGGGGAWADFTAYLTVAGGLRWSEFLDGQLVGQILEGSQPIDATLTIKKGLELFEDLNDNIPEAYHAQIRSVAHAPGQPYRLIYTPSDRGTFSTKIFTQNSCTHGVGRSWAKWIWNPAFSPNLAAFSWKLIQHVLLVYCWIQTRGITLASRCRCCSTPQLESLRHLFIQSKVARAVWKFSVCYGNGTN